MTNSLGVSWILSIVATTALIAAAALMVSASATGRTHGHSSSVGATPVALNGLIELPMPMWWSFL